MNILIKNNTSKEYVNCALKLTSLLFGCFFCSVSLFAQSRNILTGKYSLQTVSAGIVPIQAFHPCPVAGEWKDINEKTKNELIQSAEKLLNTNWGELKAMVFMEYKLNGNRSNYEVASLTRRMNLNTLVTAEVMENKGRFLPDIVNGIWAICEETYWGVPATNTPQKDQSGLPDITDPVVDLFSAETAALLAWTTYLLKPQLDNISPLICQRVNAEENRRFFTPLAQRKDFWWMGFTGKEKVNNWNPWIMSNYLATTLLIETDKTKRDAAVYRALEILDNFLNSYPEDGSCDEGPAYWFRAAASLFDCLDLLEEASNGAINVKNVPLIKSMGAYIYKLYIGKSEYFANFADAIPKAGKGIDAGMIYRYGKYVQDTVMMQFGSFIARNRQVIPADPFAATIGRKLRTLRIEKEIMQAPAAEPLIRDSWLADLQVMTARSNAGSDRGFYIAAIGGHNAESHNHNDVGSFMLYADGEPLLIDLGPETYTAKTFGPQRYEIWALQSQYHNLPAINGFMQKEGRQYAAADVHYTATDAAVVFSLDISKAYPAEAKIKYWERTITLHRNQSVSIRENYHLSAWLKPATVNFLTDHTVNLTIPGKVILAKNGRSFEALYDKDNYSVQSENVFEADPSRSNSLVKQTWGNEVNRIIFTAKNSKLKNKSVIVFRYAGKRNDE